MHSFTPQEIDRDPPEARKVFSSNVNQTINQLTQATAQIQI
jgi:hypothetical protein